MSDTILVTYASRGGATAGIAAAIGQTLADHGAKVEILPIQDITDVTAYEAVVIGSAIQEGSWLPEAMDFMRTHQAALRQRPVALFQVCMTLAMPGAEKHREFVASWLGPARALVNPVAEGLFAGAFDIHKVPSFADRLKFRLSMLIGVWPDGDHRNWPAIRTWASELVPQLQA